MAKALVSQSTTTTMLYSFDHHHLKDAALDSETTDEALMARVQQGDESALATLHRRHHALLRTIVSRMIHNDHDVDDLVQECMLEVWQRAGNYCPEKGHALGWLVTLARRRTIDRLRRKIAYGRAQDRFREASVLESDAIEAGADEEAAHSDRAQAMNELIAHLPPAQQEVIRLTFYRGLSQREIAASTGIPLGTIKTRIELALKKLRSSALAFGDLRAELQPVHT
jgi:RNA polymerase sigma-70 factor (ECF subfamily)